MPPKKAKKTKKQIEEEKSKPCIPSLTDHRETRRGEKNLGRVGQEENGRGGEEKIHRRREEESRRGKKEARGRETS